MKAVRDRLPHKRSAAVVVLACAIGASAACSQPRVASAAATADSIPAPSKGDTLSATDLYHLRSVGDVHLAPDASRISYSVVNSDRAGRPYSQIWIVNLAQKASTRLGPASGTASDPHWSPDSRFIAYVGSDGERRGLMITDADGGRPRFVAAITGTNHPLPTSGDQIAWSPDSKRVAFVSSTPGPEQDANGDPMVITRYLYKPTASEGMTRFNDNRRLHIFVADAASGDAKQLTSGNYYEHSIDWSPAGDRIVFVANHEPDPDRFFNYDIFTVAVADGSVTQLTRTKNAEYRPVWSPDGKRIAYLGTTRPLTSSETTMENTHLWVMNADGTGRHEVREALDNRYGPPRWSADGKRLYFTVQERGDTHLYRTAVEGAKPERMLNENGSVGSWSLAQKNGGDALAYALTTPDSPADLWSRSSEGAPVRLTTLNRELLSGRKIGRVESFSFQSYDGMQIEAFVTQPVQLDGKHPLIVMMHGGPHGAQGAEFNAKAQVYASRGWASLMVNYRGSTGYGQKLADAIFGDQNGGEAKDVLWGVDAALKRYSWLDEQRLGLEGGSYGGQLANWIITQTDRFRAAIPTAGISNLVTQNYLSYYHDYLAVEFGGFPHEKGIIDKLWERSAIRYANRVKTPTMFVHGENDNDVPIAEAEQFYIALQDVGVETVMIRYPREGHGVRETKHAVDVIERSIAWYERHFGGPSSQRTN